MNPCISLINLYYKFNYKANFELRLSEKAVSFVFLFLFMFQCCLRIDNKWAIIILNKAHSLLPYKERN